MRLLELLLAPFGQRFELGKSHTEHCDKVVVRQVHLFAISIDRIGKLVGFVAQHVQRVLGELVELGFLGRLVAIRPEGQVGGGCAGGVQLRA